MAQPPTRYEIRIKELLDPQWASWFDDVIIQRLDTNETLIIAHIIDQAALHGLLRKVRDLGLTLISVTPAASDSTQTE